LKEKGLEKIEMKNQFIE